MRDRAVVATDLAFTISDPSLEHVQVGGDWFDVLLTADDVAVVVVGDVVGHDIEAAATMGQLRSVIRSYAYEIDDPAGVLVRADQLVRGMTIGRLASVVLVVLHRRPDGSWQASWSSAGHLPGLVRAAPDGGAGDGARGRRVAGRRPRTAARAG
jgi:serine phosphatase RsbU (regulator of sigma subunit)